MTVQTDVSDVTTYVVWRGEPVTLVLTVGNAQVGGAAVTYRGRVRAYEGPMELEGADDVELCFTRTEVKDVNPSSDRTSVTFHLSGGPSPESYEYQAVAPTDGIVTYRITFTFVPRDREEA